MNKSVSQFPNLKDTYTDKQKMLKITSIVSYFSLRFGCDLSYGLDPIQPQQLLTTDIPATIFQIFFSSIAGIFIDVINIKYTWIFLTVSNIMFRIVQLVFAIYEVQARNVVGVLTFTCLVSIYTINFTCIMYEAESSLRERLNNAARLEVYGVKSSIFITLIFRYIIEDHLKFDATQRQQLYKTVEIYGFVFCLIINILSLMVLQKTYNKIENIKIQSIKYKNFLICQGFGLTFKNIFSQVKKRDVLYLLILSSQCGIQNGSTTISVQLSKSKIQLICIYSFGMIIGLLLIKIINKSQRLVTNCYKAKTYSLFLFLAATILQIALIYEQKLKLLPEQFYFICTTISYIFNSISWLVLYCLIHQALILLLPKRCAIRGIMLSITYFIYFIFAFFVAVAASNEIALRVLSLIITLIVIIIDYRYQMNLKFDLVEQKLHKQYKM